MNERFEELLRRLGAIHDVEKAAAVYRGLTPLTAEDVADCILFAVTRPLHVNVDELVVKALNQSSGGRIVRSE